MYTIQGSLGPSFIQISLDIDKNVSLLTENYIDGQTDIKRQTDWQAGRQAERQKDICAKLKSLSLTFQSFG